MRSTILSATRATRRVSATIAVSVLVFAGAGYAQAPADPHAQHTKTDAGGQGNQQLANQIEELRAQVAKLQATVQQNGGGNKGGANSTMSAGSPGNTKGMAGMSGMPAPAKPAMASGGGMGMMGDKGEMGAMPPARKTAMASGRGGMGMGMMGDKGGMGGMSASGKAAMPAGGMGMGMMMDDEGEMGGMGGAGGGGMTPMPAAAMGMCCMGEMGGMSGGGMQPKGGMTGMSGPSSAMPGQPGASHLYHVGSAGFFLNHGQHITLTADQKTKLNRLKERAMLDRASEQRKIDQGEQELYSLTGADQFDSSRVEAKIGEIERLRAGQRMNFIRAVGEGTNVLTHDQHLALMGTMAGGK